MTFLYKVLEHVPPPPQSIIDAVDRDHRPISAEMDVGYYHERHLKNWYGYDFAAGINIRIKNAELEKWCKQNVTRHIVDCGTNYVNYKEPMGRPTSTGAHTDGIREYVMLWDIELGGPNAELNFWQERGKPFLRPPKTQGEDLSQLEFIDKIRLPRGQWTLINTTVLHSVENLVSTRIGLHISLLNKLAVETIQGIGDTSFLKD
jgi:hypothetical protein